MIIRADDISKQVTTGDTELRILNHVSFAVVAGESLAITGVSGSGKSTLLGILAGLDLPSSGEVYLAGQPLSQLDEDGRARLRAKHVGFVFQSFQLLPGLSALQNVMLPLELQGVKDAMSSAESLLSRVGLEQRYHHQIAQLSGGEQQRVALARAFACKPDILFADEPTGNLDANTGKIIIDLLFDLQRDLGTTLIFVTHEQRLADLCDRQLQLDAGQAVTEATNNHPHPHHPHPYSTAEIDV